MTCVGLGWSERRGRIDRGHPEVGLGGAAGRGWVGGDNLEQFQ